MFSRAFNCRNRVEITPPSPRRKCLSRLQLYTPAYATVISARFRSSNYEITNIETLRTEPATRIKCLRRSVMIPLKSLSSEIPPNSKTRFDLLVRGAVDTVRPFTVFSRKIRRKYLFNLCWSPRAALPARWPLLTFVFVHSSICVRYKTRQPVPRRPRMFLGIIQKTQTLSYRFCLN